MRESIARLLESLRAQKALYAEMLARLELQAQQSDNDPEVLLALLSEQRIIKMQIEALQNEANAQRRLIDQDPLSPTDEERRMIDDEVAAVQVLLTRLIQAQGAGMEKWQAGKDEMSQRIHRLAQGRRALDAYAGQRVSRRSPGER